MSFVVIVVFIAIAALAIAARSNDSVKEGVASWWTALIAVLGAIGTWLASLWADVPVDVPPM